MSRLPLLLAVLVLSGCSSTTRTAASPEPQTSVAASTVPVLEVSRSGGWCREGACDHDRLVVRADGWWWVVPANSRLEDLLTRDHHVLTAAQRRALEDALDDTGLLDHEKPQRSCASWVDGIDTEVRWRDGSGDQHVVSSCDHDLTASDPLISFAESLAPAV